MNPKILGNKAPSTAPIANPIAANTAIPVTKLSDGTFLKITQYETGAMMVNRTPAKRAANSLLSKSYVFFMVAGWPRSGRFTIHYSLFNIQHSAAFGGMELVSSVVEVLVVELTTVF